jgi:hypothetical protein
MRSTLAFALLTVLGACGGSSNPMMMMGSPDADMGSGGGTPAISVTSADAMLMPGDQITYCYYFHTNNTTEALVNKWESHMTAGSHHAILFLNPSGAGQKPDGTLDPSGSCGGGGLGGAPVWTYATQTPDQVENIPADDGTGTPLAQKIAPNTPAVLQLHYLNASDQPLTAHIDLKAYALPAGTKFTQTDAYVTYNNDISIPPNAQGVKVTASCSLPSNVKFWTVSTHSHKQSVATEIDDGTTPIFQATDWEHPGSHDFAGPTFYSFTNNKLTWSCTYDNTGDNKGMTVVAGPSASTNEMCMATGYFFPSTGPKFEVVSGGQCFGL